MTDIRDLLNLDCRQEQNRQTIQRQLRKIKPLSGAADGDVPLRLLEKLISVLTRKYQMLLADLVPDTYSNAKGIIWRATIMNNANFQTLTTVYGLSLYEVLAKSALYMYSVRHNVGERRKDANKNLH